VADRHEAQLIVVGTREPSLVERSLGMSVSERVQRMARCDVLIVH
jgi:nucleotide-binding universal stress UspA family protein